MDNKDNQSGHPEGCKCFACHCGRCGCGHWGGGFSWLRILLAVIILVFVFGVGFKLGELKSSFERYGSRSGYHMMGAPYYTGSPAPGMMGWRYYNGVVSSTPQATGTAPAAQ